MKLKLENSRDINILQATGAITSENLAVLRAGIKKLFRDGKNKIVLELPDSDSIAPDVLRELAVLNLLASELAGQIVLAAISPLTRSKIESFSNPPAVRCFDSREKAIQYFHPSVAEEEAIQDDPDTVLAKKEEIRDREINELGDLRKRLVELESENRELHRRIQEIVIARRDPPDLEAWKTRVDSLEKRLIEAIDVAEKSANTRP
jgi:hypothetical protein